MSKELKERIKRYAIKNGCDFDGGLVKFDRKWYWVDIFNNIVERR